MLSHAPSGRRAPRALATGLLAAALGVSDTARAADDCKVTPGDRVYTFNRLLPTQPVPAPGSIVTFVFEDLPPVATGYPWIIRLQASADLGLADERLFYRIDGSPWQAVYFFPSEGDCSTPPECTHFNLFGDGPLADGFLVVEVLTTPGVDPQVCPQGFIETALSYVALQERDCNGNRRDDECDIRDGLLVDCNNNLWADACEVEQMPELDCDGNGRPDCCDFASGADDCNFNAILDRCEISANPDLDCNRNGRLDSCEVFYDGAPDIDKNLVPDACDIANGRLADCDGDGVADIAEMIWEGGDADGDYLLDDCPVARPDLFVNGVVDSADLAALLSLWGTSTALADFNHDGIVGAADLGVLLSAWGPVGICGDLIADPGENCCNCPSDVGCGDGFDCYYGVCLPCPSGVCPPIDECTDRYGTAFSYGIGNPCYGPNPQGFLCGYGFAGNSTAGGFAMNVLCADTTRPSGSLASLGLLALTALPLRGKGSTGTRSRR